MVAGVWTQPPQSWRVKFAATVGAAADPDTGHWKKRRGEPASNMLTAQNLKTLRDSRDDGGYKNITRLEFRLQTDLPALTHSFTDRDHCTKMRPRIAIGPKRASNTLTMPGHQLSRCLQEFRRSWKCCEHIGFVDGWMTMLNSALKNQWKQAAGADISRRGGEWRELEKWEKKGH